MKHRGLHRFRATVDGPNTAHMNREGATVCPHCDRLQFFATRVDGTFEAPSPGTIGICAECCGVSVYGVWPERAKAPPEVANDPDVVATVALLRQRTAGPRDAREGRG